MTVKATVTKLFHGVPDGQIQARAFTKGDVVEGKLAEVAIRAQWATPIKEAAAPREQTPPRDPRKDARD
jgi:hypothetical protein